MIARTTDYRRVKALAPDWNLMPSEEIFYLVETKDGEDIGVMTFHPCDQDGLLMHVQLKCRGAQAAQVYQNAFDWIFSHTDCTIIHGRIPPTTKHASIMARHVGGQFEGIDEDGLRCYSVNKFEKVV